MNSRIYRVLLLALVATLVLTACGPKTKVSESSAAQPTQPPAAGVEATQALAQTAPPSKAAKETPVGQANPTPKPIATVAAAVEPQPTESSDDRPVSLKGIESLQSYRQTITAKTHKQGRDESTWTITLLYDGSIPASHRTMTGNDEEGADLAWEVIQIKDATYTRMGDQWLASEGVGGDIMPDLLSWAQPAHFMDTGDCATQGKEMIDGMQTTHYRCEQTVLTGQVQSAIAGAKIDKAQIDIWVAEKLDIAIKMLLTWSGTDAEGVKEDFWYELSLTGVNQPVKIEKPPVEVEAGAAQDIPIMEGATQRTAMPGIVMYQVPKSMADVSSYYVKEMADGGWTLSQGETMLPNMMAFKKGKRSATVMLSDMGGPTQVMITSQEE